jgi:hypothetical protein
MPLVFVHGVNVRKAPDYNKWTDDRDDLFRRAVLDGSDGSPYTGLVLNPYWGDFGAAFRWNQRSVPAGTFASLGATDPLLGTLLPETPISEAATGDTLLSDVALQSLPAAVDLLWAAASAEAPAALRGGLSDFAREAAAYAVKRSRPTWVTPGMTNDDFVDTLTREVLAAPTRSVAPGEPAVHSLGLDDIKNALLNGVDRVKGVFQQVAAGASDFVTRKKDQAVNFVSQKVVDAVRGGLHSTISTFVGDIVVYFSERGLPSSLGKIPELILKNLYEAFDARTASDPLIVVGHSLGGVILYDLLTSYLGGAPAGFTVDTLVTVGSQVGVFEEMKLYRLSRADVPGAGGAKMPKPAAVGRWINIFDTNDVLSFIAGAVFEGVEDFAFSSHTDVLSAHSTYFLRTSFYERLRARLRA